ncbi:MAG TPA: hypothetical protein VGQ76_04665 [Thermoanaerobaculia bacterium]|nr:hypothetical protein [Thermoanaerobaculia bacterium]
MKTLRTLLALLIVIAAIALIVERILPRIQCNRDKGRINRNVRRFSRTGDENERLTKARSNLEACRRCLALYPEDFQLHMLTAANLRILGSPDDALRSFENALAIAERPETYAQMAEIEAERGNAESARRYMLKVATFSLTYADYVDEPMRGEIQAEVLAHYERLRAAHR